MGAWNRAEDRIDGYGAAEGYHSNQCCLYGVYEVHGPEGKALAMEFHTTTVVGQAELEPVG